MRIRALDVFMLTCAFVLVANVCYILGKHGADRWYGESIDDKYAKPICQVETKPDFTWIDDMLKERKGKNK